MQLKFKTRILFLFFMSGWSPLALAQDAITEAGQRNRKSEVFNASYNKVWDALQMAMGSYPLDYNDKKSGLIKTQKLGPSEVWRAPFETPLPSNYRQILVIEVFRLGPRTTQVNIEKQAEAQVDFVGSMRQLTSSGWEEIRLFYKTQRHLDIDKVLSRIKVQ